MPWSSQDAKRFSKKASGDKGGSKQWSAVANSVLKSSGDEGKAIRIANGVLKNSKAPSPKSTPKVTS